MFASSQRLRSPRARFSVKIGDRLDQATYFADDVVERFCVVPALG